MNKNKLYTLLLIIVIILTGCKPQKNQSVKIQKKDKAPNELGDVSKGLQDILKDIEEIEKILDGTIIQPEKTKEEKKDSGISSDEQSQGSSQDSENQDKNKSEKSNEEQKEPENKEIKKAEEKSEKVLETWRKVDKKIEDIHKKWNVYEVEGVKKGLTIEKSDKFEESINTLTKSIEARNIVDIYDYASQSMLNLSPAFELYKDEIEGEINKIKYATYRSYLKAMEEKDKEALDLLKNSEEEINKIRLKIDKDNSKMKVLDKVNMSIVDMRKSLKQKSIKLYRIKKDIIIKNLEELGK